MLFKLFFEIVFLYLKAHRILRITWRLWIVSLIVILVIIVIIVVVVLAVILVLVIIICVLIIVLIIILVLPVIIIFPFTVAFLSCSIVVFAIVVTQIHLVTFHFNLLIIINSIS